MNQTWIDDTLDRANKWNKDHFMTCIVKELVSMLNRNRLLVDYLEVKNSLLKVRIDTLELELKERKDATK